MAAPGSRTPPLAFPGWVWTLINPAAAASRPADLIQTANTRMKALEQFLSNVVNVLRGPLVIPPLVALGPAQVTAPVNSADPSGIVGELRYDANFLYVKSVPGWRRAALSSF